MPDPMNSTPPTIVTGLDDRAPVIQQSTTDRLYEAVVHLRKGGSLDAPTIDDLLRFIKPDVSTPGDEEQVIRVAAKLAEKARIEEARRAVLTARERGLAQRAKQNDALGASEKAPAAQTAPAEPSKPPTTIHTV